MSAGQGLASIDEESRDLVLRTGCMQGEGRTAVAGALAVGILKKVAGSWVSMDARKEFWL